MTVAHAKAKVLPKLDSLGAVFHQPFQSIESLFDEVIVFHAGPIHPTDRGKALSIGGVKLVDHLDRCIASLHGDVDDALDAAGIHDAQHIDWVKGVEVVVVVNHREPCALHVMFGCNQGGLRLKFADGKGYLGLRRNHGHEVVIDLSAGFSHCLLPCPGKECSCKKLCTRSLSRNASVPPTRSVESAPVTFPA